MPSLLLTRVQIILSDWVRLELWTRGAWSGSYCAPEFLERAEEGVTELAVRLEGL